MHAPYACTRNSINSCSAARQGWRPQNRRKHSNTDGIQKMQHIRKEGVKSLRLIEISVASYLKVE